MYFASIAVKYSQRVCFNLEFHNRSYITSDVYTFDVSLILPFWMYLHVVTVHGWAIQDNKKKNIVISH